jgi:hypothetical protein
VNEPELNADLITKTPGSHPVGTGVGAAVGGAAGIGAVALAGAAIGSAAGPIGTVVGIALGAVAGGLIGKGTAEEINPTIEEAYWREIFMTRPYATPGISYDDFGPAYQYGWESYARHDNKKFDDVEISLERDWDKAKSKSKLEWRQAKAASRDAWERIAHRSHKND